MNLAGGGPAAGGGVRRARAGAGDRGRARAGRGGLARQHRVPRRLPRPPPRHPQLLARHRQVSHSLLYLNVHGLGREKLVLKYFVPLELPNFQAMETKYNI